MTAAGAAWRYVFADLRTDATIDTFDLQNVTFDDRIVQPGSFRATLPVPNAAVAARAAALTPGRTVVYCYRGTRLWAGPYILWAATPGGDARGRISVALQGAGLASYLEHRQIRSNLTYTGVDQLVIARALIAHMQGVRPEGNVGILTGTALSGVTRDRTYYGDEAATYAARLTELAGVANAFEYRITSLDDGAGGRARWFLTGHPTLGAAAPAHVFTQPGNVLTWTEGVDAGKGATSFLARGDTLNDGIGDRSVPLLSTPVVRGDLLGFGWPLLDRVDDYQGVTSTTVLTGHATQNAAQYGGTVAIPTVTVRLDGDTFTPANLGDRVRVVLVNDWFPLDTDGAPTYSRTRRVVGMEVTPAARGTGQDTATLILAPEAT